MGAQGHPPAQPVPWPPLPSTHTVPAVLLLHSGCRGQAGGHRDPGDAHRHQSAELSERLPGHVARTVKGWIGLDLGAVLNYYQNFSLDGSLVLE